MKVEESRGKSGSFDVGEGLWLRECGEDPEPVPDVAHLVLDLGGVDVAQRMLPEEVSVNYAHHLTVSLVQPDQLETAYRVHLALLFSPHELQELVDLAVLQLQPFFGEHFLDEQGLLQDEGKHRLNVILGDVLGLVPAAVLLEAVFTFRAGEAGNGFFFIARIHNALDVDAVIAASHRFWALPVLARALFLYGDCFPVLLALRIIDDKLAVLGAKIGQFRESLSPEFVSILVSWVQEGL